MRFIDLPEHCFRGSIFFEWERFKVIFCLRIFRSKFERLPIAFISKVTPAFLCSNLPNATRPIHSTRRFLCSLLCVRHSASLIKQIEFVWQFEMEILKLNFQFAHSELVLPVIQFASVWRSTDVRLRTQFERCSGEGMSLWANALCKMHHRMLFFTKTVWSTNTLPKKIIENGEKNGRQPIQGYSASPRRVMLPR